MSFVKFRRTRVIPFYSDPGHGWAKVSIAELKRLGIADLISPYSYRRGEWAYLEEDGDLSTYCQKLRFLGIPFEFKGTSCANRQSRIRGYASYNALALD